MVFNATGQLLIMYSAFVRYLSKKWKNNEAVHQLFIECEKAHDSVRREVLYNIVIEFGIHIKLLSVIEINVSY